MSADDALVVNVEQAEAWDGDEGAHWVEHQARYEAMAVDFTGPLLAAAEIGATDRVLDIACGCGRTTRLAAHRATRGQALGVDLSGAMLERARADATADGTRNVRFERGDVQVHPFAPRSFEVAISRFGVMFFADPVAAFANVGAALVPRGRLAFLCWQDLGRNDWIAVPAGAALAHVPFPDLGDPGAPGLFSLADPARVTDVLTRAGYQEITTTSVEGQLRLGDDANDTVAFLSGTGLARTLLADVDADTATRALDAVHDALRTHERSDGLSLGAAAWLVTARRA